MASNSAHHRIVIIGGGTAGVSVAARLLKAGEHDVAVVEPSEVHYYQPLWTLVGGGRAPARESVRAEASVMPKDATWIRDAAAEIDPTPVSSSPAAGSGSATTRWSSAPASSSTGSWCRAWPTPSATVVRRRTTPSTSPRRPGSSSRPPRRARPCSRCRAGRSSAPAPPRRSPRVRHRIDRAVILRAGGVSRKERGPKPPLVPGAEWPSDAARGVIRPERTAKIFCGGP